MRKKLKLDDSMVDEEVAGDSLPSHAEKEKFFHNAMAEWFIADGITPNIINRNPTCAKFFNCLKPEFPPSVTEVKKEVLEIHKECKEKAKRFLKGFEGQLSLSYEWMVLSDKWSKDYLIDPILHQDFVCLAAHFIDDNWEMKKWILGYTTDRDVPLEVVRATVQDFEIESKVSTLLLPTYFDLDEVPLAPFRKWIEERGSNQINPRVSFLYCCADLFRLMVDDVYSCLSESLLEDVSLLVGCGPLSHINWNITLSKLQRAVDMKSEDEFSKDEDYDEFDKPSDEDWFKIETFCKLTGCIYKVSIELFKGDYLTCNVFFHLLSELKVMLNQELASADNDYFIGKAKQILKRFDRYWKKMYLVLATASVLDPRFKMKYLDFYCSKKEVNVEGSKAETVLDYLRNLYARYAANDTYQKPICFVAPIDEEEEEQDYGSPRELQESEIDSYLKEPVIEWNKDFKTLEWWRQEGKKYPILSRVARDILSITISRAVSQDAYVPDNREPPDFVLSLEPKITNAMMCSKNWLGL
ncbi:zinc finger BED domain-containing protein RICESLEEPER 2 [Capsella rubella]|uniref:zinc finger BED domain-containing protein RICESLEEPER 2 n=1 Tax=Capsella rubella TaxID=81985 RepID=UPI000CD58885|nr:zinc finger BED domain-containing protein RICESLEEPER 2 [Capsella rubella]